MSPLVLGKFEALKRIYLLGMIACLNCLQLQTPLSVSTWMGERFFFQYIDFSVLTWVYISFIPPVSPSANNLRLKIT